MTRTGSTLLEWLKFLLGLVCLVIGLHIPIYEQILHSIQCHRLGSKIFPGFGCRRALQMIINWKSWENGAPWLQLSSGRKNPIYALDCYSGFFKIRVGFDLGFESHVYVYSGFCSHMGWNVFVYPKYIWQCMCYDLQGKTWQIVHKGMLYILLIWLCWK